MVCANAAKDTSSRSAVKTNFFKDIVTNSFKMIPF